MAPRRAGLETRWADDKERTIWYHGGAAYWANTAESNDGVLGGFGDVHEADTEDSLRFARRCGVPSSKRNGGERVLRALDVASGIGRVTGGALLELCDTVDLVEVRARLLSQATRLATIDPRVCGPQGCHKFVERAKVDLAWAAPRVERFICETMQDFTPEAGRYDVIWLQWCIGCVTDDDLVTFLSRCCDGLTPNGMIVIKDNVIDGPCAGLVNGKYLVDHDDNSVRL